MNKRGFRVPFCHIQCHVFATSLGKRPIAKPQRWRTDIEDEPCFRLFRAGAVWAPIVLAALAGKPRSRTATVNRAPVFSPSSGESRSTRIRLALL